MNCPKCGSEKTRMMWGTDDWGKWACGDCHNQWSGKGLTEEIRDAD